MKVVELDYSVPTVQNYVVPVSSPGPGGGGGSADVNVETDVVEEQPSETAE